MNSKPRGNTRRIYNSQVLEDRNNNKSTWRYQTNLNIRAQICEIKS